MPQLSYVEGEKSEIHFGNQVGTDIDAPLLWRERNNDLVQTGALSFYLAQSACLWFNRRLDYERFFRVPREPSGSECTFARTFRGIQQTSLRQCAREYRA